MTKQSTNNRDDELRKRFNALLNSGVNRQYFGWKKLIEILEKQDAPCFYISPKMAEQYVYSYLRGEYKVKSPRHQAMVRDLVENYHAIIENCEGMQKREIWERLVERPAKSFYLGSTSIKKIVYEYRRPKTTNA